VASFADGGQNVKRLGILVVLLIVLLIGGGLTTQLIARQESGIIPALRITGNTDASVLDVVPWKAEQFFLALGFILFNLVGMGATIALVFWLLDRAMKRTAAETAAAAAAKAAATPTRAERSNASNGT
jgi:hypothetical protein